MKCKFWEKSDVDETQKTLKFSTVCPDWFWGPPSLWGVKQLGHKADHLLPSTARLKMSGAMPLLSLYAFKAWTAMTLPFLKISVITTVH
jgi:hypothetical protein